MWRVKQPNVTATVRRAGAALALLLAATVTIGATPDGPVSFHQTIRPLLSDRCFKCHGPDEKARKARLRFDRPDEALTSRDVGGGRRILVPGNPDASELYRRLVTTDSDDLMPPPSSNLALTSAERELFRRWIQEGAEFSPHWAFVPPTPRPPPRLANAADPVHPIDAFVRARLEAEGLAPSPEADRTQLLRRLRLDLTGLPPTLAELDTFLADSAPGAYERLVDRLLALPAYGEARAVEWLDLARFADTYGYQSDVERDLSPWRDWVIRAFNENLPYDQFLVWQTAGDLLPGATRDQVLATAFNRLHRQTNEGGSIDEEFRVEYVADRVHTFGTAFLGLTLECARCHDHKYDPIAQRDYYRLFAFFNRVDESGLYSHFTQATPAPGLLLYADGVEARHRALEQQVRASEAALAAKRAAARAPFLAWLEKSRPQIGPPSPIAAFPFETAAEGRTPNLIQTNQPAQLVDGPELVEGRVGKALRFTGDNLAVCKGTGAFGRTDPFSVALWLKPTERQPRAVIFHRSRAWSDSGSRGYELVLEDGRPAFALIHFWPGNAIKLRAHAALPTNAWTHLVVTYDGSSRAGGMRVYVDGTALPVEVVRDRLYKDIQHRAEWGDSDVGNIELTLAGRFRDSGFRGGLIDELAVFDQCLTAPEVAALAGRADGATSEEDVFEHYLARCDDGYRAALADLRAARQAENALINDVREIMVMADTAPDRPAHVLKRGAYDAPGERVEAGTPEAVFPFPAGLPPNRLGLARWLTDPKNPLTARVAVNRAWRVHFGRGLVATAEDFGNQGELPTHPELLDWLAAWFVEHGWDLKGLHRLIVTSQTYRQSSRLTPELAARDPDNRLLARGPRHRLRAEQIRDSALAVSGLLNPTLGGPSVRPYQPAGLWEESGTGKTYVQDKGDKLYRRSLYTFWRRTAPPPSMLTFDAPTREVCTAKRETTATPLQALVLLNDPQFVEAARVLAEALVREFPANSDAQIARAFRLATAREPEPRELEILRQLLVEQRAWFAGHPDAAARHLTVGERPADPALPAIEVASVAAVTTAVLNHYEFVMKR